MSAGQTKGVSDEPALPVRHPGPSQVPQIVRLERMVGERDERIEGLLAERNKLRALLAEARGALMEVRAHLRAAGRRPETCHEMSVIDEVLMTLRSER